MSKQPILEIKNLHAGVENKQILKGVSLTINPGEVHAVLGENGAGKSTIMRIAYGFYNADSGAILVEGRPVDIPTPHDAIKLGIGGAGHRQPFGCGTFFCKFRLGDAQPLGQLLPCPQLLLQRVLEALDRAELALKKLALKKCHGNTPAHRDRPPNQRADSLNAKSSLKLG
jgi:ABC-type cobalamin/Fe3+-siderophores transport system ATPase subunit